MFTNLRSFTAWKHLIFGSYSIDTVLAAVKDPDWQRVRIDMLGRDLEYKFHRLTSYIETGSHLSEQEQWNRRVQVTNYVYALKRGGLIK